MRFLRSFKTFPVAVLLGIPLAGACTTSAGDRRTEAEIAAAEEVNELVQEAALDTTEAEITDYTVTDYQGFNPNGIVVHFDFEKADLTPKAIGALNKIVAGMKKDPLARITIRGHADKQGPETFNEKLSAKRAKVIKSYLLRHGIEEDRLDPVFYGEREPVQDEDKVSAYKKNRRGDFHINYGPSAFGPSN